MFFSKKTIEQRLRDTEAKRKNVPNAKAMEELAAQYLDEVNGGWWRAYARWRRSF
ncbi:MULTISPECIES: hypothetical protein [unclassified Gilliamella]|uniref:hypothetical protein n=1 Tax=unclassified Gilliamella TaxID=2685620 RepID=UPI00130629DC|nr:MULTISPECIES: hypothetical protein [unclassified Gilliamella]MWP48432.1 hypothetical protein [Gilliamella sp. Lep-s35]MWP68289.1 hypothetical protein [Gilliamella sp. Lep-s5]MWP76572.1 hypothetical protein [Gilliamella sp. Lep-s21]